MRGFRTFRLTKNSNSVIADERCCDDWIKDGWLRDEPDDGDPAGQDTAADELIAIGVRPEWVAIFIEAGLDSVEKVGDVTAEDLDSLEVSGLGPATAAKLIEAARA